MDTTRYGFVRVAAATPQLRVADCAFNTERIIALMRQAHTEGVGILVFPELSLTGYTCGDLFQQTTLQRGALQALEQVAEASDRIYSGLTVVGMPFLVDEQLFNCAAVLCRGQVLGIVPKTFLPNYKEFYEGRWFTPASTSRRTDIVVIAGQRRPFGTDLIFEAENVEGLLVGVEICEDLWVPLPPSCFQALRGATVLLNLSASNEVIGKAAYRRQLVANQSGRCLAAYIYAASGVSESTTDLVFGGHSIIAENGTVLAETPRFRREDTLLIHDIDLGRLRVDRQRTNSFIAGPLLQGIRCEFNRYAFQLPPAPAPLRRDVDAHPFVPRGKESLRERCEEIFQTQVAGLAKRLEHVGKPAVSIGISGGLDSTLALLVTRKTFEALGIDPARIRAFTMPGFGTSARTLGNAKALMKYLGVSAHEVDIRALCLEQWKALGHRPFGIDPHGLSVEQLGERLRQIPGAERNDLVFENVQARMRTSILMNAGFVIGTGDVSELALGWCTYNGDHMSMYNPNVSIPKTLVKFLVGWAAENEFAGEARRILQDIVATEISPELLPAGKDGAYTQATEETVGPYELNDFFLFHFLRYGATPEKILFLAEQAKFHREYTPEELRRWLAAFLRRLFASQFKRSCLPDGPKVGSISLSPRGDWRMPSDAQVALWLASLQKTIAMGC
jgi:NAD+ synthase (glutamine-hydrolysing)